MPEFRHDPLSDRWVIIAEDRAGRPSEFAGALPHQRLGSCPFCAGSERETPDPIAVYRGDSKNDAAWQVRVIPNKFPAVRLDATMPHVADPADAGRAEPVTDSPFARLPGIGVHEVIIESPDHVASFTELREELALTALRAYQDRLTALSRHPDLHYGLLFKNCRGGSGATLEHVHSQLLATSIIPTDVARELTTSAHYFQQTGHCLHCDLLRWECQQGDRLVAESERLVAYCPYASRFPYETRIVPKEHASRFELADSALLEELRPLLLQVLVRMEGLSPQGAYNYWIHTAPFQADQECRSHWHWELIPRVTTQAGYEWGAGCFVNAVSPESAARSLRSAAGSGSF